MVVFSCGINLGCGVGFYGYWEILVKLERDFKERL